MHVTNLIGILYAIYVLLVLTLMGLFAYAVSSGRKIDLKFKIPITLWIVFLAAIAVIFHILTFTGLPWVKWEIMGNDLVPSKEFSINIKEYEFQLPQTPLVIKKDEPVKFTLTSDDVTYGFGIFRKDGTMVFQIQVVPGHKNDITWRFQESGKYSIRSTEYSGPEHSKMYLKNSIEVKP